MTNSEYLISEIRIINTLKMETEEKKIIKVLPEIKLIVPMLPNRCHFKVNMLLLTYLFCIIYNSSYYLHLIYIIFS